MTISHANRGQSWEAVLDATHRRYGERGLALVYHQGPPVRILRPQNRRRKKGGTSALVATCEIHGVAPPDYGGCLAGGRAVTIEAKSTIRDRWRLAELQDHQARALDRAHDLGALALVLLWTPTASWVLPWEYLRHCWWRWHRGEAGRGEASLTADACDQIGARCARPGDWLPVVRRLRV